MKREARKIISVTGTKGKTTVVYLIDEIMRKIGNETLRVDTTGHFVNNNRKSTLADSKRIWNLVPSVCPGRYMYEFLDGDLKDAKDSVAVLECSLGCSSRPGLGYNWHKVGIFTNVFEDHLGTSSRLKNREDIAKAKSFIFDRVKSVGGYSVFNADDKLVVKTLLEDSDSLGGFVDFSKRTFIPCGREFSEFDIDNHIKNNGVAFAIINNKLVLKSSNQNKVICDFKNIPWAFGGRYEPSVLNIMYAVAGVYGSCDGNLPNNITEIVESIRLDKYGGRVTVLNAKNGAMIIADYAHEKVSLATIGKLATEISKERGGESIGVARLAFDRTDDLIRETGAVVGNSFDKVVVYDKIDGYWRAAKLGNSVKFKQRVGHVSKVMQEGVKQTNQNSERILREDEALERASELAGPNDVVVVIVNDDIRRSIDWIKEKFEAEFI